MSEASEQPTRRPRRRTAVLAALAVLVTAVVVGVGYAVWPRGSTFERATSLLPAETLRVSWTHWAGVREELDTGEVSGAETEEVLLEVADRDLAASSLSSSALLLEENLGFNPVDSDWEMLGQGRDGQLLVVQLAEGTDVGAIGERFAELGFDEPGEGALSGEVWLGGPDVISNVPGLATYELQNVAFLEDERLLVASDSADYLESQGVPAVTGEEDGLDAGDLAGAVGEPLTAVGFLEDYACEALSMASAAPDVQQVADGLVEEAGGVTAMTGYLVGLEPGGRISVVFTFEDEARAEQNARSREALAGAEDPAQFVAYPELFSVSDVEQDGTRVLLTGETEPDVAPLSNLTQGPVLLAAC